MDAPEHPPARRIRWPSERTLGLLCVGVLTALSLMTAVWAVVLLPPVINPLAHPSLLPRIGASLVIAGPGLFFITLYAGRAARSRVASAIPAFVWLLTVVTLAAGRPEGDSAYLLASYQGLLLAPLGMAAAAFGTARAHRTPWAPEPDRNQAFPAYADS